MMRKFLYGKKEHLWPIVTGERGPRFSEISHYALLENGSIRDDEDYKRFMLRCANANIEINNLNIPGALVSADIQIKVPVEHCFCLCLSGKKNDPELFEKFKADICIEIDVAMLTERLNEILDYHLPGARARGGNVRYYDPYDLPESFAPKDLAFWKPKEFSDENEYRVAIFYPSDKTAVRSISNEEIPIKGSDDKNHIMFAHEQKGFITDFVMGYYSLPKQ